MDTKQRTRSDSSGNRNRSTAKNKNSAQRRRPESAARSSSTARRTQSGNRRPPEEQVRRQRPVQGEQVIRRAGVTPYQPSGQMPQEQVFKPDQMKRTQPRSPAAEKRAAQRRRSAQRIEERKKQEERAKKRPKVAYTQPKPFNLNRLLLQLSVVVAVVLAITMGMSVFFKVEKVMVYGNKAYSAWTIQEASGIENGENLMSLANTRASGRIIAALPYVEDVRIGIKLPDTVNIYIEEYDVAYAIADQNGSWWLMTSGGKVVEQIDGSTATGYTKVLGVELDNPIEGEQAKAVEELAESTDSTEATDSLDVTLPPSVTGADRLKAALLILNALETNDMVGQAASVDVSSVSNIELWYGQQYQVKLGSTADMDYKIASMKKAVSQLNEYETGILDVSFTTWPDQPGFTPFE